MTAMDDLESELVEVKTVDESILVLLKRLSEEIKAAGPNAARLKVVTDWLDTRNKEAAAAVIAYTPADPTVPPTPPAEPGDPTTQPATKPANRARSGT